MATKKTESQHNLVKLRDATKLRNQYVNLLGIIHGLGELKQCQNKAWLRTLYIIDDSYPKPGLTLNVFSNNVKELPEHDGVMILLLNVKMKTFDDGKRIAATCNQRYSSFALYNERTGEEGFVCYKRTWNFRGGERYESSIEELRKVCAPSGVFDQAFQSFSPYKTKPQPPKFSFLREINERKLFNLVCKILHVDEDMSAIFVWDGTDAPPTSIGLKDKSVGNLSVHTLLPRDTLRSFPTVGTILRVFLRNHLFHGVKPGDWVKLYQLRCVDNGSWISYGTDSTKVTLAQDDHLVEKIMRIYDKRITSKFGHIPSWSVPSPPRLTETDDDQAPFVTLMDIITFPKVTYKYRCIVRVVSGFRFQVEDDNRHYRALLTLEDPTATLEAFLCDQNAEYFWGLELQNTQMLRTKWNQLLGRRREGLNPPWIKCCIFSYYTDKADPWNTRLYKIFGTRLLD